MYYLIRDISGIWKLFSLTLSKSWSPEWKHPKILKTFQIKYVMTYREVHRISVLETGINFGPVRTGQGETALTCQKGDWNEILGRSPLRALPTRTIPWFCQRQTWRWITQLDVIRLESVTSENNTISLLVIKGLLQFMTTNKNHKPPPNAPCKD